MAPNGTLLAMYPSDEFPLSSLPFGPKALVDVPFLAAGCEFLEISKDTKRLQSDFFKLGNASLGPSYV